MSPEQAQARLQTERAKHPNLSMREWYRAIYLSSPHWIELRTEAIKFHGKPCHSCRTTRRNDVHHLNYRQIYNVTVNDLQVLCRRCHKLEHGTIAPPRPKGVNKRLWREWVANGCVGVQPAPFSPVAAPPNPDKRPPGVPRKEWSTWIADGRKGPEPRPGGGFYDGTDERNIAANSSKLCPSRPKKKRSPLRKWEKPRLVTYSKSASRQRAEGNYGRTRS